MTIRGEEEKAVMFNDFFIRFLVSGQHGLFGKTRRPRTAFTVESAFNLSKLNDK
jgi:hypothetical protein